MDKVFILTLDEIMLFADDTISLMISLAFCPLFVVLILDLQEEDRDQPNFVFLTQNKYHLQLSLGEAMSEVW